jgi:hypothetical protein
VIFSIAQIHEFPRSTSQQSARNPTSLQPSLPRNHWSQRVSHFAPGLIKTLPSWPGVFSRHCRLVSTLFAHLLSFGFAPSPQLYRLGGDVKVLACCRTYLYTSIPGPVSSASSISASAGTVGAPAGLGDATGGCIALSRVVSWSGEGCALETGVLALIERSSKGK